MMGVSKEAVKEALKWADSSASVLPANNYYAKAAAVIRALSARAEELEAAVSQRIDIKEGKKLFNSGRLQGLDEAAAKLEESDWLQDENTGVEWMDRTQAFSLIEALKETGE